VCITAVITRKGSEVSADEIVDKLFVALKAKVPRLRVDRSSGPVDPNPGPGACTSGIWVRADFVKTRGGFAGGVDLDVMRWVTVHEARTDALVAVWSQGETIACSPGGQSGAVGDAIDDLVTHLAVAYYDAGNP
jgi:hypothetical protein